jgi:spore coat polysaccharide biosynthesis protein SpsF
MLLQEKWHSMKKRPPEQWGTILAFLQARMGSTRLPGKVLMQIRGQSILERAIRRLQAASIIDGVVVLTTMMKEDDAIERETLRLGATVYRGSEQDVLLRFKEAADKYNPDIIVRATADNPLIDIGSVERIVQVLYSDMLDFCMERDLPYGSATEAVRTDALHRVHLLAKEAHHREHVTLYMKDNPETFRTAYLKPPDSLRHSEIRLTVDTMEDFRFMEHLIGSLPEGARPLPLKEYIPIALGT